MRRNQYSFKNIPPAVSQRTGLRYPHNEMVYDEYWGLWVHYSEVDDKSPSRVREDKDFDFEDPRLVDPPLPDTNAISDESRDPYYNGTFHLSYSIASFIELDYDRGSTHPERVLYMYASATENAPPPPDSEWNMVQMEEHDTHVVFPYEMPDGKYYYNFLIPPERHDPTHFYINKPNGIGLNQMGALNYRGILTIRATNMRFKLYETVNALHAGIYRSGEMDNYFELGGMSI